MLTAGLHCCAPTHYAILHNTTDIKDNPETKMELNWTKICRIQSRLHTKLPAYRKICSDYTHISFSHCSAYKRVARSPNPTWRDCKTHLVFDPIAGSPAMDGCEVGERLPLINPCLQRNNPPSPAFHPWQFLITASKAKHVIRLLLKPNY